jgi:hypothetical protein
MIRATCQQRIRLAKALLAFYSQQQVSMQD